MDATERARPKSANLAKQSESKSIFDGFRSRWIRSPECMYFNPFKTLYKKWVTDKERIFYEHFQGS